MIFKLQKALRLSVINSLLKTIIWLQKTQSSPLVFHEKKTKKTMVLEIHEEEYIYG